MFASRSLLSFELAAKVVAMGVAGLVSGCVVSTRDTYLSDGTLNVDWNINGSYGPGVCAQYGAATFSLDLVDGAGRSLSRMTAPCDVFTTSFTLAPDRYTGFATLLDANGAARTTSAPLPDFGVDRGYGTEIPVVNFPASSFK